MCGRFSLHTVRERIVEHFGIEEFSETGISPRFNIAPSQVIPVVRLNQTGRRELVPLRWGLIPHSAKEPNAGYHMINARAETVALKPAFRDSFRRKRCLIPADGFFEWQPVGGKSKQPWFIHPKDGDLFGFASLWDHWQAPDGKVIETFTIIVTDANDLLQPFHDRMPSILAPTDYDLWLDVQAFDRDALQGLLRPYPSERLRACPVSSRVNSPKNDDELCPTPVLIGGS